MNFGKKRKDQPAKALSSTEWRERIGEVEHNGHGFVEFSNRNYVDLALQDSGRIFIRGRRIMVEPVRPKEERPPKLATTEWS